MHCSDQTNVVDSMAVAVATDAPHSEDRPNERGRGSEIVATLTLPSLSTSLAMRARPMGRLDGAEVLEGAG